MWENNQEVGSGVTHGYGSRTLSHCFVVPHSWGSGRGDCPTGGSRGGPLGKQGNSLGLGKQGNGLGLGKQGKEGPSRKARKGSKEGPSRKARKGRKLLLSLFPRGETSVAKRGKRSFPLASVSGQASPLFPPASIQGRE